MPHLDRIKVSSYTEVSSVTGTWCKLPQPDLCCLSLSHSHTEKDYLIFELGQEKGKQVLNGVVFA